MALFKTEKPKQFTFIPRFYDQQKEELQDRIDMIRNELEPRSDSAYRPNIRGRMRSRHDKFYGKQAKPKKGLLSRWAVMVIYVGLIAVIVYLIAQILAALF